MTKKLFGTAVAVAALGTAFAAAPAANAAAGGGGCQLSGTAYFSTPLGQSAKDFTYHFHGGLSNCQSTNGAPASGTVFAGEHGLTQPSGNGSCANSTTAGESVIQWAGGATTVLTYKTTSAAAIVVLTSSIAAATTETDSSGHPLFTTSANSPVQPGATAGGLLTFGDQTTALACANNAASSAPIGGAIYDGATS